VDEDDYWQVATLPVLPMAMAENFGIGVDLKEAVFWLWETEHTPPPGRGDGHQMAIRQ